MQNESRAVASRFGVFVNIGCTKDARLNVSKDLAKAGSLTATMRKTHLPNQPELDPLFSCKVTRNLSLGFGTGNYRNDGGGW